MPKAPCSRLPSSFAIASPWLTDAILNLIGVALFLIAFSSPLSAQMSLDRVFTDADGKTMNYRVFLPERHEDESELFPVVMWLHGSGGDIDSHPDSLIESLSSGDYQAIVVAPHSSGGWTKCKQGSHVHCPPGLSDDMVRGLGVLEEVERDFFGDPAKRVLMGYSDGGVGTFDVLLNRPGYLSAAVPAQSGFEARRFRSPVETPVWALHGSDDTFIRPEITSNTIAAMMAAGDSPIYLEPPGGHGATYMEDFFADENNELYPWLFNGHEPPLAKIIYDPSSGSIALDATTAPGAAISRWQLRVNGVREPAIEIHEILGDALEVSRSGTISYEASDELGFSGKVELGQLLEPGLSLAEVHGELETVTYRSSTTGTENRLFQVEMTTSSLAEPVDTIAEEPWVIYSVDQRRDRVSDLGLSSRTTIDTDRSVVAKFLLPEREDADATLESATLSFLVDRLSGADPTVSVWHSEADNDFEMLTTDLVDDTYRNTELEISPNSDPLGAYLDLDVTDVVLSDYANDLQAISSFRLQLSGDPDSEARVAMPGNREAVPLLTLSFGTSPMIDCNGDGATTFADFACIQSTSTRDVLIENLGLIAGDLDGDGEVSFGDFTVLAENFGRNDARYTDGDIDVNGKVNFADFLIVASNFGVASAMVTPVPEPSGYRLILFVSLLLLPLRKSRQFGQETPVCWAE